MSQAAVVFLGIIQPLNEGSMLVSRHPYSDKQRLNLRQLFPKVSRFKWMPWGSMFSVGSPTFYLLSDSVSQPNSGLIQMRGDIIVIDNEDFGKRLVESGFFLTVVHSKKKLEKQSQLHILHILPLKEYMAAANETGKESEEEGKVVMRAKGDGKITIGDLLDKARRKKK